MRETPTAAPTRASTGAADPHPGELYFDLSPSNAATRLEVDPANGLTDEEVERRRNTYGPNVLSAEKRESRLHAFLRQYRDLLQVVLVVAAIVSFVIGEVSTGGVVLGITLFNALLGLHQEAKAAKGLSALQDMLKPMAVVRRNGEQAEVAAEDLVPGDVVMLEGGDRVPGDGRLLTNASLETDEASLTGESTPVLKQIDALDAGTALADRTNMVFANTIVTRGSGSFVVTATGMDSQVGQVAGLLKEAKEQETPLQVQIRRLTKIILVLAAFSFVAIVLILRLREGDSFTTLFTVGVALAIGAIPDALPAIVTAVLAMGTERMARHNAIMKTLPSTEALGSTSAICTDKTGTLTVGEMTVRELVLATGESYTVTGIGYSTDGVIRRVGGAGENIDHVLLPMALDSDATIHDDNTLVGDPNEGALVALAMKGGIDVEASRTQYPRKAVLPFDSAYMLMATFHDIVDEKGRAVVRCFVKGAPDVLLERSTCVAGTGGVVSELTDELRANLQDEEQRMGDKALRVMAVARKDFDVASFDADADLLELVSDLEFLALAGMIDPPREAAKPAIERCHAAGIQVRMITGDQLVTAKATAAELGIDGQALTGHEFSAISDDDLAHRVEDIGIVARVAPADKVRMVRGLQEDHHIVAMTGDGVNDAPALKTADIGVAMGTGTDVAKDAGKMILADDNFATIVEAVETGRALYDNLMKYIRVQMANLVAFIAGFLLAAAVDGDQLFDPGLVITIHFIVVFALGTALGFDTPAPDLMRRPPRKKDAPVIAVGTGVRIFLAGALVATATMLVDHFASDHYGSRAIGTAMAFTTFAYGHIVFAFDLRYPRTTIFNRVTLTNTWLGVAVLVVLALPPILVNIGVFQEFFGLAELNATQWAISTGAAFILFVPSEIAKAVIRYSSSDRTDETGQIGEDGHVAARSRL